MGQLLITRKEYFLASIGLIFLLFSANTAKAENITFPDDTTLSISNINMTIQAGSGADMLDTFDTTFIVTTGGTMKFIIRSDQKMHIKNSLNLPTLCETNSSRIEVPINQTVLFTPTTDNAVCTSLAAVVAPAASVGGGSATITTAKSGTEAGSGEQKPQPDPLYYQLPEKNESGIKFVVNKSVKFPASGPSAGKVTKKTLMKNTENKSSYLLQFGAKVKKSDGKPYTGLITGTRTIGIANNLPGIKLPKDFTILDRTEVQFDEPVKISGKFELKLSLPQSVLKSKNFNPKDKKRFKIYNYNAKSKKWESAGLALVGKDKKSVYVKTSKYGFFMLVDTKK